jgi:beta-1,4-N-acetylglucosaminyltransferase
MIFLTVGSIRFDELVRVVDTAVGRGLIAPEVVLQIGNGSFEPVHCRYFRSAPGLGPYYDRADLVIGHGGTGTTLEVLERGLRLISVRNPHMIDDHQNEFLEALEGRGLIRYCRDLGELPEYISASLRSAPPPAFDAGIFFRRIAHDIEHWQPTPPSLRESPLQRLFARRVRPRMATIEHGPGPPVERRGVPERPR